MHILDILKQLFRLSNPHWLALLTALSLLFPGSSHAQTAVPFGPASGRVTVDGRETQELVPEWIKWEAFFRFILRLHGSGTDPALLELNRASPLLPTITAADLASIISCAQASQREKLLLLSEFRRLSLSRQLGPDSAADFDRRNQVAQLNARDALAAAVGPYAFAKINDYVNQQIARRIIVGEVK